MTSLSGPSIFAPRDVSRGVKGGAPVKSSFVDKVVVHVLPAGTTEETSGAVARLLMVSGTSDSKTLSEWKSYVATYTLIMFPTLRKKMTATGFSFKEISADELGTIRAAFKIMDDAMEKEDKVEIDEAAKGLVGKRFLVGLPVCAPGRDWMSSHGECIPKVYACHYSLVLFLAGKRIDGDDHSAMTVRRPQALKKKAHLGDSVSFLDGSMRLSDASHVYINSAWSEMSLLRSICIQEFSRFSGTETDFIQDLIHTTMHLLRYSGMQHARITHGFLKAYPWVVEIPVLKTSLGIYVDSAMSAAKYPEHLQPYLKLMYGDKTDVFPRKELEPLIACAVAASSETNESLKDFYTSGEFGAIVEAFLTERERRENIREGEIRKQEHQVLTFLEEDEEGPGEAPTPETENA